MDVTLRPGTPEDAADCGRICYEAFAAIAAAHSFPADFPSPQAAAGALSAMLSHPGVYGVIAEVDGQAVGSNFLDERSAVAGVGPITVAPEVQDAAVGRQLMTAVLDRGAARGAAGVRLVQTAYHNRSLSLYAKLGFRVREPLACLQGPAPQVQISGHAVRLADPADAGACNRLCATVHGVDRAGELADAISRGRALVVEHDGRVTGYSTGLAFSGHSVGETNEDVKALLGAVPEFPGPGLLVPLRNTELFGFCLDQGLRVIQQMTLMTTGLYDGLAPGSRPSCTDPVATGMLTISQLADYVGVTVRAVRHYHQRGLLPEPERDASGYRRYGAQAVVDLIRIKTLSDAGVPLARIADLMSAPPAQFSQAVADLDQALASRIQALQEQRHRISQLVAGDRLFLPADVAEYLSELRDLGVRPRTVEMERGGWILLMVRSADRVTGWIKEKRAAFADPEFRRLYLACDQAFDWDPADPRLEQLADDMLAFQRQYQTEAGSADVADPVAVDLLASLPGTDAPAWQRLNQLYLERLEREGAEHEAAGQ